MGFHNYMDDSFYNMNNSKNILKKCFMIDQNIFSKYYNNMHCLVKHKHQYIKYSLP